MGGFLSLVLIAGVLSEPATPATSCAVPLEQGIEFGISVGPVPTIPADGVIPLSLTLVDTDLDTGLSALELTVEKDDMSIAGEIELSLISEDETRSHYVGAWRPDAPLEAAPGYMVHTIIDNSGVFGVSEEWDDDQTLELLVSAGPAPELEVPQLALSTPLLPGSVAAGDTVCCTTENGCGPEPLEYCQATEFQEVPWLILELQGQQATYAQIEFLVDGGESHFSPARMLTGFNPPEGWSRPDGFEYPAVQDEYCAVAHATSLITGETIVGEPRCEVHDLPPLQSGERDIAFDLCLDEPWIDETGEPYDDGDDEAGCGCRSSTSDGVLGLWAAGGILLLAPRRRRATC